MTAVKGNSGPREPVDAFEPQHLGYLLDQISKRLRADLDELDVERLFDRYHPLRSSSFRLLALIPAGGARVTDVAALAGMTKQALGQFVDVLEQHGYVDSLRDPADRRTRIISRTAKGDEVVGAVNRLFARLDAHWRGEIGNHRFDVFREVLLELARGRHKSAAEGE